MDLEAVPMATSSLVSAISLAVETQHLAHSSLALDALELEDLV